MRIYLDHNATTPLRPEVIEVMAEILRSGYGNPSSSHYEGCQARERLEQARIQVADCVGAEPADVCFTAGASEANNMVLLGLKEAGQARGRLITTRVEHPSVIEPARWLERAGMEVIWLPVDSDGLLDPAAIFGALTSDTRLVSLIWANNETGVIQPMQEIAQGLRERGVALHVDATQAVGKWPVDLRAVPATYLSLSAHKLNGPKGAGALVSVSESPLSPLILGGPQERRLRGGTENVSGIVGLGEACALAQKELPQRMENYRFLRDRLWKGLRSEIPSLRLNGHPDRLLPNTLNFEVPQMEGEVVLQALDLEGVAISAGAACHSGSISPSHVLVAMGRSPEEARGSLRVSVGHGVDVGQVDLAVERFVKVLHRCGARSRS